MYKSLLLTFALVVGLHLAHGQAHRWPLTSNVNDTIGLLNGTNHGVTFQADPERGSVAIFNGSSYLNVPSFINGHSELTLSIWYRMDVAQIWARVYTFGNGDQVEPKDIMHFVPINGCCAPELNWYLFTMSNPGLPWYDLNVDTSLTNLKVGQWNHQAVVIKTDSVLIYHNGTRVRSQGGVTRDISTMVDTSNALGKSFWPDALWNGAISDFRVYYSPLTEGEVGDIYSGVTSIRPAINEISTRIYAFGNQIKAELSIPATDEKMEVYTLMGAKVAEIKLKDQSEVRLFEDGIYLVKVEGSHTHQAKLVRVANN